MRNSSPAGATAKRRIGWRGQPGYVNDRRRWQVVPDGQRFLLLWPALLKK